MAKIGGGQNSGDEKVSYPTDTLREVAQDILNAVQTARQQHNQDWKAINHYINSTCAPSYQLSAIAPTFGLYSGSISGYMSDVLEPHAKRLSDSYDWLETFANALTSAANAIDQTEQAIKDGFQ